MQDSGEREVFETGGVREPDKGKGFWELIPYDAMIRIAVWYEEGAEKYGPRNWEKGLSVSRCVRSAMRHLWKFAWGWDDEDHLAAVVWNCFAIMFYEKNVPGVCDLPRYKKESEVNESSPNNTDSTAK